MFGFIGSLFGSEKTVDKAMNGIDMVFYTDEERAIAQQKKQEFYVNILKAYEPFKVAQRLLAIIYSVPYVSIVVYCIIANNMEMLKVTTEALGLQNMIILGFYFGGGAFEGVVKAKAGIK